MFLGWTVCRLRLGVEAIVKRFIIFKVNGCSRLKVRVLLVKLSRSVRSSFVGFVYVVDKSIVRRR